MWLFILYTCFLLLAKNRGPLELKSLAKALNTFLELELVALSLGKLVAQKFRARSILTSDQCPERWEEFQINWKTQKNESFWENSFFEVGSNLFFRHCKVRRPGAWVWPDFYRPKCRIWESLNYAYWYCVLLLLWTKCCLRRLTFFGTPGTLSLGIKHARYSTV